MTRDRTAAPPSETGLPSHLACGLSGPDRGVHCRLMGFRQDGWLLAAATGVVGITFGVLAQDTGLTVTQSMAMSALVFTGASQFAAVTVIAGGGTVAAAVASGLFLGVRNAFYGPVVAPLLPDQPAARVASAHFVIDETTAMATAQSGPWGGTKGLLVHGALALRVLEHRHLHRLRDGNPHRRPERMGSGRGLPGGLHRPDRAAPRSRAGRVAAVVGGGLTFALLPLAPAGIPILAAAGGVLPGWLVTQRGNDR